VPASDPGPAVPAGLLLLADSRLPRGGHVHSGGVEALVERGLLAGVADLTLFLDGRVRTAGRVAAGFAAAAALLAATTGVDWVRWDRALDARTPAAGLREASRAQGTALLRTARGAWPDDPALHALPRRAHQPLVLGAAAHAAGAGAGQAAALAVHHLVGGAATAAVRLLGLDPLAVAAAQAGLAATMDTVAAESAAAARASVAAADPDLLPTEAAPLPEILAELHAHSEVTLFAS
jgi:urease accessory protein